MTKVTFTAYGRSAYIHTYTTWYKGAEYFLFPGIRIINFEFTHKFSKIEYTAACKNKQQGWLKDETRKKK